MEREEREEDKELVMEKKESERFGIAAYYIVKDITLLALNYNGEGLPLLEGLSEISLISKCQQI